MSDRGRCRAASCRQEIMWVRMAKTGKANPLDPEPSPLGNVEILDEETARAGGWVEGTAIAHGPEDAASLRAQGKELRTSHFATCPARQAFRGKGNQA